MGQTLEEWLTATQAQRDALQEYGKSQLPRDIHSRLADLEKSIQCSSDAANFLADAEQFLSHAKSVAMYAVLEEKLTAKERETVIKDSVRMIQRLVDGLKVTNRCLKDRLYATMNANRAA